MASATGTAIVNFGGFPGSNEASVVVPAQVTIGAGSKAEAYFMADDETDDHDPADHRFVSAIVGLTCGAVVPGSSFTIFAYCMEEMQGTFQVRWVWAD